MQNEDLKKQIHAFMKTHELAVISTIDSQSTKPEAALVAFAERESLEIIFGTLNTSRKYVNLQNNQHVSFVIGWSYELGTLQYEGTARELSGDEARENGTILADKNERARMFLERDDQRYFIVQPTWIRWTDRTQKPQAVSEVTF